LYYRVQLAPARDHADAQWLHDRAGGRRAGPFVLALRVRVQL
jgi:hypothetical protein